MARDYYQVGDGVQLLDVMKDNYGAASTMDFCIMNAVKYLFRCKRKHSTPTEDLYKAMWYCEAAAKLSQELQDEQGRKDE